MRNLFAALLLSLVVAAAMPVSYAQETPPGLDDPLPLPPPPIDEYPLPPLIGSGPPAQSAASPLPEISAPAPVLPAAPAQGTDAAAAVVPVQAVPPAPEVPKPARISGGRVNVRAGPSTQYESVGVLTTGAPLTVLARHGEWYKVAFPQEQMASIHKNFVTAEITGEIPEAGVAGVVNQDDVDVHAFYWDKSTVVGKVAKGDGVTIRQERGQWYRIAPPPSARAFVFAEYVRVEGNAPVPADSSAPPENPAVNLAADKADGGGGPKALSENDRQAAALKEAYFKRLVDAERMREEEGARQVSLLEEGIDSIEAKLRAIDQETGEKMAYPVSVTVVGGAADWSPPDPAYGGYTGWVENIGRVGSAPANFRLVKGGEIRFYLRSDRHPLEEYAGRRVWVNGDIALATGALANILSVNEIRPLTEAEAAAEPPAGQVVQPAPADVQPQAPLYDPTLAAPSSVVSEPFTLPDHVGGGYSPAPVEIVVPSSSGGPQLQELPQSITTSTPMPVVIQEAGGDDRPVIMEVGP